MVTPRGKTERERGGGAARPKKSGGRSLLIPARTDCPWRASGGGGPPRRGGGLHKVTPGSGSGADPAWPALEGPEVQIVTLVTVCAEEIFTAHSGQYSTNRLQNNKTGLCVI